MLHVSFYKKEAIRSIHPSKTSAGSFCRLGPKACGPENFEEIFAEQGQRLALAADISIELEIL